MIVVCPYCGKRAVLQPATAVYGPRGESFGNVWTCADYPECDAYVGVHREDPDAKPLGTLANAELRKVRMKLHAMLDANWKGNTRRMTRQKCYREFAKLLGISASAAHVGSMDLEQCERALLRLEARGGLV